MKLDYKKALKLLTLLMGSAFIATASAMTYHTMQMHATNIGVDTGSKVFFIQGAEWPGGSSALSDGNQTATLAGMKGQNGTITTIEDPLSVNNTDTVAHNIQVRLDSWDGNLQTQLYYINITLYNAVPTGGTRQGDTIYLVPGGSGQVTTTGISSLGAAETWRVEWVIYWKSTATTETVNVNLLLEIKS